MILILTLGMALVALVTVRGIVAARRRRFDSRLTGRKP